MADLVALMKPRIVGLALITAAAAMALAPGEVALGTLVVALVGTGLCVGAANALNMYLERDVDCLMARTRHRPLPGGRMDPAVALAFGAGQAVLGVPLLTFACNPLTGLIASAALVAYVNVYTPLKQRSTAALLVGAFPGAAPVLIGHAAAAGSVDAAGLALFGVLFVWQVPHFCAISLFRCEDYRRAGIKILPNVRGDEATRRTMVATLVVQVALSIALVPLYPAGVAGTGYLVVAIALGTAYLGYGLWGLVSRGDARWARRMFLASIVYLPLLLAALVSL
jgi:protoheme IX farnesyltransferase